MVPRRVGEPWIVVPRRVIPWLGPIRAAGLSPAALIGPNQSWSIGELQFMVPRRVGVSRFTVPRRVHWLYRLSFWVLGLYFWVNPFATKNVDLRFEILALTPKKRRSIIWTKPNHHITSVIFMVERKVRQFWNAQTIADSKLSYFSFYHKKYGS